MASIHIQFLHKEHKSAQSRLFKRLANDSYLRGGKYENQARKIARVIPLHFKAAKVNFLMGSGKLASFAKNIQPLPELLKVTRSKSHTVK